MSLVWVTGNSGAGKSTVCELLQERGEAAFDADWGGFSRWVDRASGQVVADPPDPVPAGWLRRFGWKISRAEVEALVARTRGQTAFLCGSAENEAEVRDLFDRMVCLVVDSQTLRDRLLTRTTNDFGKHPEELAAALAENMGAAAAYRRLGATIIDGTWPPEVVADAVLAAGRALAALPADDGDDLPASADRRERRVQFLVGNQALERVPGHHGKVKLAVENRVRRPALDPFDRKYLAVVLYC